METIIQLHTTTSRCIIIQQIFGKTIPNFQILGTQNTQGHLCLHQKCYHSNLVVDVYRKFQLPNLLGRFQNRSGTARHIHHTRQTLAQGRLEERHDKAGRTPENAEPSLLLYDPLGVSRSPTARCWTNLRNFFEHVSGFTGCIHNQFRVKGVDQHWIVMINLKKNVTKQIESLSYSWRTPPRN